MDLNIGDKDPVQKILWDEQKADRVSGGFTLPASILPSATDIPYLLKGALLAVNYTSRVANLMKTATFVSGGGTTNTRISKDNVFIVGDVIADTVGNNSVAITAIDRTNDSYDVLTHLTNGGAYTEDIFLAASVGSSAAYKYTSNAILSDNAKNAGSITVTGIIGALEIQGLNLSYPHPTAIRTALGARFQYV